MDEIDLFSGPCIGRAGLDFGERNNTDYITMMRTSILSEPHDLLRVGRVGAALALKLQILSAGPCRGRRSQLIHMFSVTYVFMPFMTQVFAFIWVKKENTQAAPPRECLCLNYILSKIMIN